MALTKCGDCGTEVSMEAKACPKCGRPMVRGAPWRLIGLLVILALVLAWVGALWAKGRFGS